jgi:hypothetical protein
MRKVTGVPLFSSRNSWSAQASKPGGMFHPEKRCPPVEDCTVKNFVVAGKRVNVRNARHLRQLQRQQAEVEKRQKEERKQKAAAKKGGWPNAGKYDPAKGKARGK